MNRQEYINHLWAKYQSYGLTPTEKDELDYLVALERIENAQATKPLPSKE